MSLKEWLPSDILGSNPGFTPSLPLAKLPICLGLSFPTCNMGIRGEPTFQGCQGIN